MLSVCTLTCNIHRFDHNRGVENWGGGGIMEQRRQQTRAHAGYRKITGQSMSSGLHTHFEVVCVAHGIHVLCGRQHIH